MKKLREEAIKIGDIILTTTTASVSKVIRLATKSDISHAMIYVQHHSVIDATDEGVHARNTQRLVFDDECPIYVLRSRADLSAEQAKAVCTYVRARVGTQYSTKEAMRTALGGARQWTRKQFCSRLVAQAFASVGVMLVDDPNFCSPAELKDSSLVVEVQNATIAVTAAEAAAWQGGDDILENMRTVTNVLFDGARKKNKDIQDFDDLNRHLTTHPEDDEYFCEVLASSGFLTIWEAEKERNPWHYDVNLVPDSSEAMQAIEAYCWGVLWGEEHGPNRFIINRGGYTLFSRQYGLRFFRMMADLYDLLATLHAKRVEVATKWLETRNLLEPTKVPTLRPHTPEWFNALEVWNPGQGAHTRAIIQAAGSPDVCSVCGDDPASDYRLEESSRPPAGVDTLRLCADCLRIRSAAGEPFVALEEES